MKRLAISLVLLGLLATAPLAAVLPEPDHTVYGTARIDGIVASTGSASLTVDGEILATYELGSDPALGICDGSACQFALRVPMDFDDPTSARRPGSARPGDEASLWLDGELAAEAVIGAAGEAQALDLDTSFQRRIPGLSVVDTAGSESLAGPFGLEVEVTLRLSYAVTEPVSVDWQTTDGDAQAGTDYTPASGVATFAAGETRTTVLVTVLDDAVAEADPTRQIDGEAFFVELTNPTEARLLDAIGTVRILDDDTPPALTIANLTVVEPPSDAVESSFTVRLSHVWDQPVSFSWAAVAGSADAADFELAPGSAVIPAGELSTEIPLQVLADGEIEDDETFEVRLSDPIGASLRPGGGRGTILSAPRLLSFVERQRDGEGGAEGLFGAIDVALSPDGRHLYAAGRGDDALALFERQAGSGRLAFVDAYQNGVAGLDGLAGLEAVTVSPDGERVYAAAFDDSALAVFERDPIDGTLTLLEIERDGQRDAESGTDVEGLNGAIALAVAPADGGGEHLYVAGSEGDAVAVFARDPVGGLLSFAQVQTDGEAGVDGLGRAVALALAPGGEQLYVASLEDDAVAVFDRDPISGQLSFVEQHSDGGVNDGLDGAAAVAVSPDGANVYVAGQQDAGLAVFERLADGRLSFLQAVLDGTDGVSGLELATDVAVSRDGRYVYATGFGADALAVFARGQDGLLAPVELERDDQGGIDGLDGATSLAVSGDDLQVYATGALDDAVAVFRRDLVPPMAPAALFSTSHSTSTYSALQVIDLQWSEAGDEDAGSGVSGYFVLIDGVADTVPETTDPFVPHGLDPHGLASEPQPDGDRFVHLLTCDYADNCTVSHAGPFRVDATPPAAPTALDSPSHGLAAAPTSQRVIEIGWSAAVDALSGLGTYGYSFNASSTWSCDLSQSLPAATLGVNSASLADGSWYFHLCAADLAGNQSAVSSAGPFVVDTTAPANPDVLVSTSHQTTEWSADNTLDFEWSGATDANGVAGYSLAYDNDPDGLPDATVDQAQGTDPQTVTSPALADRDDHYFHLATCDLAGNCASALTLGPFAVDTTAPEPPTTLSSTSHTPGVASSDIVVEVSWDAALDATSGVVGYGWEFTTDGSWTCDGVLDGADDVLSTTSEALSDGSWTFYLCALDTAGNLSAVVDLGPLVIETEAPIGTLAESTSHQPSTWDRATEIAVEWSGTTDPNGVAGYSYVFDTAADTLPDETLDLAHGADPHTAISESLADGDSYYFHLRSCDVPNNCGAALHLGPFWIETIPPTAVSGLRSVSHPTDDTSTLQVIDIVWDASSDDTSGVAGYAVAFETAPDWTCDQVTDVNADTTEATSSTLADGTWYAHVCAVDQAGNWTAATSAGPYAISTAPATVTATTTVADTGDGQLDDHEATRIPITQLYVDFSRPMTDPAGDSAAVDVTNPASWQLVAAGGDGDITTADCAGAGPDDQVISVDRVDYSATPRRANLWINGGVPLPAGRYRLLACAEGLRDEVDDPLDGNADGLGGDDFELDFTVLVSNGLLNPNFDEGLEDWLLIDTSEIEITHDGFDADSLATSGSARIAGLDAVEGPFALAQCLAIDADDLALRARVRIDSPGAVHPTVSALAEFFTADNCLGDPVATFGDSLATDTGGDWPMLEVTMSKPAGTVSVLVSFATTANGSLLFDAYFDVLFFGDQDILFADGFESGDTTKWSGTVP